MKLSRPLPKALLVLLVIIGVIYYGHSASGFETDGGCETFCASCDQGGVVNLEVENLMTDCNCCLPPLTGEAQSVAPSQSKFGKTRDDDDDGDDDSQDR